MNMIKGKIEAEASPRVPPAPMWREVKGAQGVKKRKYIDLTVARVSRYEEGTAFVALPSDIMPAHMRVDILEDGAGRVAYHPNQRGRYKLQQPRSGNYHIACIPAQVARALSVRFGTHEVPLTEEGGMFVIDLTALMGARK